MFQVIHRVILPNEEAVDREAAERTGYLENLSDRETLFDPAGVEVPDRARRFIKSEVGARAITDLMAWYERQWADSVDFKNELIELLDASKFGTKEYTPYEVYTKALYEYFKEELGENSPVLGRRITCLPDEPRYIGLQDIFALQDQVIDHILAAEAKAAVPTAVDPIQQAVCEEIKDAIRRRSVDREQAKTGIGFLGQPMGRALHVRLKAAHEAWKESKKDAQLVREVATLAEQFGKQRSDDGPLVRLGRQDLELICFAFVSG